MNDGRYCLDDSGNAFYRSALRAAEKSGGAIDPEHVARALRCGYRVFEGVVYEA